VWENHAPKNELRPLIRPRALRWCYSVGRRAWLFEVREFLFRRRQRPADITLLDFWGPPQEDTIEVVSLEPWIQESSPRIAEPLTRCFCEAKAAPPIPARRAAARSGAQTHQRDRC
jgi:hypothetical protein